MLQERQLEAGQPRVEEVKPLAAAASTTAARVEVLPTSQSGAKGSRAPPREVPAVTSEEEPPWLEALRLLEAAASRAPRRAAKPSPKPSGFFPATAPAPAEPEAVDSGLQKYLSSFQEPSSSAAKPAEADWAKKMRLLEAVRLPGRLKEQQEQSSQPEAADPRTAVRMSAYQTLLNEADRIGKVAPGASIPVKFGATRAVSKPPPQLPKPPASPPAEASSSPPKRKPADGTDPLTQAVGRGNLVASEPPPGDPTEAVDNATLRKEDLKWSEHDFNDGDEENKRVLKRFTKEFQKMAAETPDGLRDAKLLTAALDLALACVKCYELDKADAIYRRAIVECRRRGMPWDVKCLQDLATLRCKQHRQADAAELLEELAAKAPPHPATFINLGTVYNQLRQYEKAESWFLQAVNLKGGVPGREDLWNLGIAKKNQGNFTEALEMLEKALVEYKELESDQPVTLAKLHSSLGGCLHDMGRTAEAVDQYQEAYDLYVKSVGRSSPLFCSAAEGLAKALKAEGHLEESFEVLLEAFHVHANHDAVHPTPLFEDLEMFMRIQEEFPEVSLARLAPDIDAAVHNLDSRGQANDGNAGLVMCRGAKALARSGDPVLVPRAVELLQRGMDLIRKSHDDGEANLSHEILEAQLLLQSLQAPKSPSTPSLPTVGGLGPFPLAERAQSLSSISKI